MYDKIVNYALKNPEIVLMLSGVTSVYLLRNPIKGMLAYIKLCFIGISVVIYLLTYLLLAISVEITLGTFHTIGLIYSKGAVNNFKEWLLTGNSDCPPPLFLIVMGALPTAVSGTLMVLCSKDMTTPGIVFLSASWVCVAITIYLFKRHLLKETVNNQS